MTIALADLVTLVTKDQAKNTIFSLLKGLGLPVNAWQSGNPALKFVDVVADLFTDVRLTVQNVAKGGYLDDAAGDWLTLLAKGFFQVDRKAAVFTEGKATLTCASGAGPHTISAGQLTAGDGLRRFTNTTGGTLSAGPSTLQLTWKAESPGAAWNVPVGTLTTLHTPLPGVAIANPDIGGGTWRTIEGVDEESDPFLRDRCRLRWATLAIQTPADAYKFWALTVSSSVTRVYVDDQNPDGPGTARVYLAGPSGPVAAGIVTNVNTYIQPKRPISSVITTLSATSLAVPITGTVYASAASGLTNAVIQDAVSAFFRTLDIGGDRIPALDPARLFKDQIEKAIQALPGVKVVDLTGPASDLTMTNSQVAVPTFSTPLLQTF